MVTGDRSDIILTIPNTKCHYVNFCTHNKLSCSRDGSDRAFNFSGARREIDATEGGTR